VTRYTVICPKAEADLAHLWLEAGDRTSVAEAADAIERELRVDADIKGEVESDGLRRLIVRPLSALFILDQGDRKATIWSFSLLID
jgi:hypothetical protein